MLAAGRLERIPSIAAIVCGDDAALRGAHRRPRSLASAHWARSAAVGGMSFAESSLVRTMPPAVTNRAIEVPLPVDLFRPLPDTVPALHASLRTSTTREDLRRIRKAGFDYRITTEPDTVRTFYARYVTPLLTSRFPEDGKPEAVEKAVQRLSEGAELVCLDLNGEWVAGILNGVRDGVYRLGAVGIRDGDEEIRRKHAIAALLVRSFERAVEYGCGEVTLGHSVPFLGKGSVWFKAKWGGVLRLRRSVTKAYVMADLRDEAVRRVLADRPLIHCADGELAVSLWLRPGATALEDTVRDAGRYPGVERWFVLGERETIIAGGDALAANRKIVPVPVELGKGGALWLGELLRAALAPDASAALSA